MLRRASRLLVQQQQRRWNVCFIGRAASKNKEEQIQQQKQQEKKQQQQQEEENDHQDAEAVRQYMASRETSFQHLKTKLPGWSERVHSFSPSMELRDFRIKFSNLETGQKAEVVAPIVLAGRIMSKREAGEKLAFFDIHADGEKIQVHVQKKTYDPKENEPNFEDTVKLLHRGDIIGVEGIPGRTPRGELTLYARSISLVTPCLQPLPTTHFGLKNPNLRFRNRHVDFLVTSTARDAMMARSAILKKLRSFMDGLGFVEVETPMMSINAGGANARPFQTHHIEMGRDLFLRIAPELWLKRLVIGGMPRVFEVGKSFRNEGVDMTHNPEFTTVEAYHAYWSYLDVMDFSENILRAIAEEVTGELVVPQGEGKEPIDFSKPFQRLSFLETIEAGANCQLPREFESEASLTQLDAIAKSHGVFCPAPFNAAWTLDKLADKFILPLCYQPTFVINTPTIMSPLAKRHPTLTGVSERFELFIRNFEVVNAYSELTDPKLQRANFLTEEQRGDDEKMPNDEDFVQALEVGLPPTGGWGLGVDRLCMLLTGQESIKEVMAFPFIRPDDKE